MSAHFWPAMFLLGFAVFFGALAHFMIDTSEIAGGHGSLTIGLLGLLIGVLAVCLLFAALVLLLGVYR